jgi:hypothetical protein
LLPTGPRHQASTTTDIVLTTIPTEIPESQRLPLTLPNPGLLEALATPQRGIRWIRNLDVAQDLAELAAQWVLILNLDEADASQTRARSLLANPAVAGHLEGALACIATASIHDTPSILVTRRHGELVARFAIDSDPKAIGNLLAEYRRADLPAIPWPAILAQVEALRTADRELAAARPAASWEAISRAEQAGAVAPAPLARNVAIARLRIAGAARLALFAAAEQAERGDLATARTQLTMAKAAFAGTPYEGDLTAVLQSIEHFDVFPVLR